MAKWDRKTAWSEKLRPLNHENLHKAENFNLLMRRKKIADRGSYLEDTPEEIQLAKVLSVLEEYEVERAADVNYPIFRPAYPAQVMEKLAQSASTQSRTYARWGPATLHMNRELLMNRWRACLHPSTKLELDYTLSMDTVEWFRVSTYEKISELAEISQNLTKLNVNTNYIYLAAKGLHNTRQQRLVLAVCQRSGLVQECRGDRSAR